MQVTNHKTPPRVSCPNAVNAKKIGDATAQNTRPMILGLDQWNSRPESLISTISRRLKSASIYQQR